MVAGLEEIKAELESSATFFTDLMNGASATALPVTLAPAKGASEVIAPALILRVDRDTRRRVSSVARRIEARLGE